MIGMKDDINKPRWELLMWEEIEDIVRGLTYGAINYDAFNWREVQPKERYIGAMIRHFIQYTKKTKIDTKTGLPTLALAALNALFLLWRDKKDNPNDYKGYKKLAERKLEELRMPKWEIDKTYGVYEPPAVDLGPGTLKEDPEPEVPA